MSKSPKFRPRQGKLSAEAYKLYTKIIKEHQKNTQNRSKRGPQRGRGDSQKLIFGG